MYENRHVPNVQFYMMYVHPITNVFDLDDLCSGTYIV